MGLPSSLQPPGIVAIVEDDDATRRLMLTWLERAGLRCHAFDSGESLLHELGLPTIEAPADEHEEPPSRRLSSGYPAQVQGQPLDAIVLDVRLPGRDGFSILAALRRHLGDPFPPVLMVSAHAQGDADIVSATELGALDYLFKPFAGAVLVAKVRGLAARAIKDRSLLARLDYAETHATVDALTGLYNRGHFERILPEECAQARRHRTPLSLAMLDLDGLKMVNDLLGHTAGDQQLRHFADAIRRALRQGDLAFRFGGDEFVVLLRGTGRDTAREPLERLRDELRRTPLTLQGSLAPPAAPLPDMSRTFFSAGLAFADATNDFDTDDLFNRADAMLYEAKRRGKASIIGEP